VKWTHPNRLFHDNTGRGRVSFFFFWVKGNLDFELGSAFGPGRVVFRWCNRPPAVEMRKPTAAENRDRRYRFRSGDSASAAHGETEIVAAVICNRPMSKANWAWRGVQRIAAAGLVGMRCRAKVQRWAARRPHHMSAGMVFGECPHLIPVGARPGKPKARFECGFAIIVRVLAHGRTPPHCSLVKA